MDSRDGRWVDWWIVPHFVGWAIIMAWLSWFFAGRLTFGLVVDVVFVGSFTWELVEYARERVLGYAHEPITNRLLTDPVVNVLGGLSGWWLYNHSW